MLLDFLSFNTLLLHQLRQEEMERRAKVRRVEVEALRAARAAAKNRSPRAGRREPRLRPRAAHS